MSLLDQQNRAIRVEILPDYRRRVTRRIDLADQQAVMKTTALFTSKLLLDWGTPDADYPECLLVAQSTPGQIENAYKSPNDPPPYLTRVFEELSPTTETQVGDPSITYDQDDILEVSIDYIALSTSTPTYQVPGATAAPAPFASAILKEEIRTNDGTLQRIKRNYIASGTLSDVSEIRFGGKVIVRTITAIGVIPPTPSGYTLVGPGVLHPDGREIYTYQFVNGSGTGGTGGEIDRNVEYFYSPDQGVTGITRTTIKYVTANTVVVNPITGPAGSELISVDFVQETGFKLWTASYAQGTGLISDDVEIHNAGKLYIYKRTAINAVPATPSATIGGTVTLVEDDVQNGTRIEDGTKIYRRTWYEANGTIDNDNTGTGDGSIIYRVTTLTATATTPAYPGAGTAYLVNLKNEAREGHYLNVATYHKPPATVTLKQQTQFEKPGVAQFTSGTPPLQLVLTPPVTLTLLADMEVSYDTAQLTNTPFSVTKPASFYENYTPTATGIPVTNTQAIGRYLGIGDALSGSASVYNGVLCDTWQAVILASVPTTFPTGATVLHVDNEIYLTALDGTVVFRRRKVSYTF